MGERHQRNRAAEEDPRPIRIEPKREWVRNRSDVLIGTTTGGTVGRPVEVEVLLEAFVGGLEAVLFVEQMRLFALSITRQLDAIATEILGPAHGVFEELVADSCAALICDDVHRLDLGAATAAMLEVAECEELQHADDAATEFGYQQVGAISPVDLA